MHVPPAAAGGGRGPQWQACKRPGMLHLPHCDPYTVEGVLGFSVSYHMMMSGR